MKCGIEIHQRLSGSKLFCSCTPPSENAGKAVSFTRRLHAVKSELGELDSAVRMETVRERNFHYEAPLAHSCLVEADEEPPHGINKAALSAALCICHLLSSRPVDELHVMRKNVIDGSNTAGFQRTAVLGMGGSISIPSGTLEIQAVCIEEESSGILEGKDTHAQYDLGRLGIPLVEIATAPTLKSGREAQEAALAIGTLLRKTGMVSRGIGTIRQDLNISIPEGARVEIKGVQELSMIEKTVELEVGRQAEILKVSSEAKTRLAGRQIEAKFYDLSEIFAETHSQMASKMLKSGSKAVGMALPGYGGLLGREVSPNRRFGSELADYARSAGLRGLIHSDESMEKYGFSEDEISEVRAALSLAPNDAFVIVLSDEKKAYAALSEVCCRANFFGVPEETRKAAPDGTSSYMRPLPGKARLYPETDLRPVPITPEMLAQAAKAASQVEKNQEQKEKMLSSVNGELAAQLSSAKGLLSHHPDFKSSYATPELSVFSAAVEAGVEPKFAVSSITNTLQSLKREGIDTKTLDEPRLLSFFIAYKNGLFAKSASQDVLRQMCKEAGATVEGAVKAAGAEKITGKALEKLIKEEKLGLPALMSKYRIRVDAQEAGEILKKLKK